MSDENNKMRNHALLQVQAQVVSLMDSARQLGTNAFKGQGHAFAFQAVCSSYNYLAGLIFMERHSAEECDRLNTVAGTSPWGFAALDIPQDECLMHALVLGKTLYHSIEMRRGEHAGIEQPDYFQLNFMIRDAARDAVRLVGEENSSENVRILAGHTDAEITALCDENEKLNDLLYSAPAGRA